MTLAKGHLSVVCQHFQMTFPLSETTGPISFKFHMQLQAKGERFFIFGPGHMTKMAAMPIYGKTFKQFILQKHWADCLLRNLVCSIWGSSSFDDPRLTMTYFMARSTLFSKALEWKKAEKVIFSDSFVLFEMETQSGLILLKSRGQGHLLTLSKVHLSVFCRNLKKILSFKTTRLVSIKFYMQPLGKRGKKFFIYGL